MDGVEHPEPGEDIRKPWSSIEVKATVSDYFDMLRAELEGTPYSKTAQRNALLKRLPKRSAQAVESKHCNISAVLRDMKLTYIAGYKPRGNYQDLLAETVEDYLVANPGPRKEIVELDADPVDAPPDGSKFVMADIEVPPPQPTEARRKSPIKAFKTDWGAVTAHSRKLGEQGERFVLELERRRLRDAGQLDLEPKIEWVSQTRGDGAGYDIKSFDSTGTEILIEVKTTKGLATDTDCFVANSQTAASAIDQPVSPCSRDRRSLSESGVLAVQWVDARPSAKVIALPFEHGSAALAYTATVFRPILPHSLDPELYSTPIVRPPAQFNAFYR